MRRLLLPLTLAACVASVSYAATDDPLRAEAVTDELSLARVADEAGDAALVKALEPGTARDVSLVAVRSAPHAAEPERLVPKLAALAYGRDPVLAPEAVESLLAVFERLKPSELAAREVLMADLRAACASLSPPDAAAPRPDLALALGFVVPRCRDLLGAPTTKS